ncbi:MAG: hypothetical protein U9R26_09070 [Campylobacterota bacterium]|nr:hypothetical protein [Campylobacterota bacterium]
MVAHWDYHNDIAAINLDNKEFFTIENSHNELGVPYGFFEDRDENQIINAYFGSFDTNPGGFTVLKR